jgi:D-beta-D-heptose 7-phosphate kinase / D-beta-D-heptose 1-phosphate adenosyltransferase
MDSNLIGVIDEFENLTVLVVGEAMLDSYLQGVSERLCREAPVPVVSVTEYEYVPGGAANTAVNVASLGANAIFLSVCGDDTEGDLLRQALSERGVSTEYILNDPTRRTLAKQRVLAGKHMLVRFDQGSTDDVGPETEARLLESLRRLHSQVDAVIVSDYDYGILTRRVIAEIARLQAQEPRLVVVDSKRLDVYQGVKACAVKPNYAEAVQLLGLPQLIEARTGERVEQISSQGERLRALTGSELVAVTLDRDGALFFGSGEAPYRTYSRPRPNSRAAGAGDTFASALTLALAAGAPDENAAELASAAASLVVDKDGTAACHANELRAFFTNDDKYVPDAFQLAARMAAYRREKRRVIFTNGCFDILHRGHITYLNRAKELGDVLIIGLNSDESVRRLKGENRPINALEDRAQILSALSCVDHIVPFSDNTPLELIRQIRPDVYVKGGDYTLETLPEAPLVEGMGGEVHILPYLDDHSTTSIIKRIREIYTGPEGER